MDLSLVDRLVNAVLYEGYILYPYRASAIKNRHRFNFGVLYPPTYPAACGGTESCSMRTECLVLETDDTTVSVRARFLHLVARETIKQDLPVERLVPAEPASKAAESLKAGGGSPRSWHDAVEREISLPDVMLRDLASRPLRVGFSFPEARRIEPVNDSGRITATIIERQEHLEGEIELSADRVSDGVLKLRTGIKNLTESAGLNDRDESLLRSLVWTHTILSVSSGEFVSLFDPPEPLREVTASCQNVGAWPVLVGEPGERDVMLSSPIILYDYPRVAPESASNLFDSTEIDELLTLRIMTLTEDEKRQIRETDARARRILEETEALPVEHLMKLHGAVRSFKRLDRKGQEQ